MPCTIEPYCRQVTGTRRAVWVHSELQVDKFCQKSRIFIEFRALRWWDTRVFSTHRRGGKCYVHDGINACFRWIGWNAHFHAIYRATVVDGHVWDSISPTNLHYSSCYFYVNLYLECVHWMSLNFFVLGNIASSLNCFSMYWLNKKLGDVWMHLKTTSSARSLWSVHLISKLRLLHN